ncbi:MAG: hypothetical protein KGO02_25150, partial [Alphaproteobacteria bacterium]|nr:hypothetical protein [Alphaproteobacteria bacterium]
AKLEPNFVPSYLQIVREIPKTASEKPQDRFLIEAFTAEDAEIYVLRGTQLERLKPTEREPCETVELAEVGRGQARMTAVQM